MKSILFGLFLVIILSSNLISCVNKSSGTIEQNKSKTENKIDENKNEENKVDNNIKEAMVKYVKIYFDIDISNEELEYSVENDTSEDSLDDEDEVNDANEVYVKAHASGDLSKVNVINIEMKYNKKTNDTTYINLSKAGDSLDGKPLTIEEATPIAEKFIKEQKLIVDNIKLTPDSVTSLKGISIIQFSYKIGSEDKDIEIGINNGNKEVRMFDID